MHMTHTVVPCKPGNVALARKSKVVLQLLFDYIDSINKFEVPLINFFLKTSSTFLCYTEESHTQLAFSGASKSSKNTQIVGQYFHTIVTFT